MKRAFVRNSWITAALVSLALPAQSQAPQQSSPQSNTAIRARSEAVLLDVVVRDKKSRLVTGLTPEDFQIFDNGEPRKIDSFRLVEGAESTATGGVKSKLDPLRQIRLVTLIFHCTNVSAQKLSREAALDFIKGGLPQNIYVSVMAIDHRLEVLQAFTNDPALLRNTIEHATQGSATDFMADSERVKEQLERSLDPASTGPQSGQAAAPGDSPVPNTASLVEAETAKMLLSMYDFMREAAIRQTGQVNISALFNAIREQYRLPGRKTVLYFTEGGFAIPQGLEASFDNIISTANRSNVSFYTIDARGLSISNKNSAAILDLNRAAAASRSQTTRTTNEAVSRTEANVTDLAIQSTRGNTQNTLANLAESTGGKLIADTNDLKTPMKKLAEDIETYYEISYIPEIKSYDGSFHKITIKTSSPDLRVQSRSGYFALPPGVNGIANPLHAYEIPLLNALASKELPRDFPLQSAAMHFRGPKDQPLCVLAMDVPLGALALVEKQTDQWEGHLSYVVLVKNEKEEIVRKFQNEIPINIPAAKIQAVKTSHFTYTEHIELPPGHYSVQAAALDSENENRMSARKISLFIPAPSPTLGLSSVVFVRNMKDKDTSTTANDPLVYGSQVIWPELHAVLKQESGTSLPFYVALYVNKSSTLDPRLTLELIKDGVTLGQTSLDLTQLRADQEGRIPYLGTIPLASLKPGQYTIRFVAQQGPETAEEFASITIE